MIAPFPSSLARKHHLAFAFVLALPLAVVSVVGSNVAASAATTLNFEDQPPKTTITTQYSGRGVIFPQGAYLDTDSRPRSGTRVLRASDPTREFHSGAFVIQFTSPQSHVRVFAGTTLSSTLNGTLRGLNASAAVVARDGPRAVAPKQFTTMFEVRTPQPSIVQVELEMGTTEFEAIDDLEFEGQPLGTLPTAAPLVQITSLANDAQLDVGAITVQGTVTGDGLLPAATLKVEHPRPPWSTAPPFQSQLPLSGPGRTRTFALSTLNIWLGPQVLTVDVENTAGLKGGARVSFTNLPGPIRTRYAADGGQATFGNFSFDQVGSSCKMAVYERGGIALVGARTFVVRDQIFNKWLAVRDQFGSPRLGCPTTEGRSHPDGARSQDFAQSRIYAGLPTGTHYGPLVFAQAIDQLGGEAATGTPIADPRKSIGVMQTWLFQQFRGGPGQTGRPVSTLEIRGTPPILWVERQGGYLSQLPAARLGGPSTPTLWQRFPCSGHEGPCNVSPPTSPPPLENAGNRFCDGTTIPGDRRNGRPWSETTSSPRS